MNKQQFRCEDLRDGLGDFLDGEAVEDLCREIERHLTNCKDCRVVVDRTLKTITLYQADHTERSVEFPVAVSQRLMTALAGEYRKARKSSDD